MVPMLERIEVRVAVLCPYGGKLERERRADSAEPCILHRTVLICY